MLCADLVGRAEEVAALDELLARLESGVGAAVVITGEAGVGKSRLISHVASVAVDRGVTVLMGHGASQDRHTPYRPLTQALAALARRGLPELPELAPFRPALGGVLPDWRDSTAVPDEPVAVVAEGILRLMLALGRDAGAVLILDDLQWADDETVAIVEYLVRASKDVPIACVLALRSDEPNMGMDMARELVRKRQAIGIELARLTADDAVTMAAHILGQRDDVSARIAARADGLPFLVEEVAAAWVDASVLRHGEQGWGLSSDPDVVVPQTLVAIMAERLRAVGETVARVVRAASVVDHRFDWSLLPEETGLDDITVLEALRQAVEVQLLAVGVRDRFEFRHALTREAVQKLILPPERSVFARRALAALHRRDRRRDEEWYALAADLAEQAGDRDQSAELLLGLARLAVDLVALASARAALARASARAESPALAERIELAQVEVLALVGDLDTALAAVGQLEWSNPSDVARAHLQLGRTAVIAGRHDLAAEQLKLAAAAVSDDEALEASVMVARAELALATGRVEDARRLAVAVVEKSHPRFAEAVCAGLQILGRIARPHDLVQATRHFSAARRTAEEHGLTLASVRAMHELGTIDMFRTGDVALLEEARSRSAKLGASGLVCVLDLQLAGAFALTDQPQRALSSVDDCLRSARILGLDDVAAMALAQAATAHALVGQFDDMERCAEQALAVMDTPDIRACVWGHARGMAALLREDRLAALRAFDLAVGAATNSARTITGVFWAPWALLRVCDGDLEAPSIVRGLSGTAVPLTQALLGYSDALIAGREGNVAAANVAATRADDLICSVAPWGWLVHLCRRLVADAALDQQWGEPVRWLREALAYFASTPHRPFRGACRSLLARAGVQMPRRGARAERTPELERWGITARELDVVSLLPQGLSNREIGARLYLSPRTVEKHLASVMSKIGAHSRTQVAAWISAVGRHT